MEMKRSNPPFWKLSHKPIGTSPRRTHPGRTIKTPVLFFSYLGLPVLFDSGGKKTRTIRQRRGGGGGQRQQSKESEEGKKIVEIKKKAIQENRERTGWRFLYGPVQPLTRSRPTAAYITARRNVMHMRRQRKKPVGSHPFFFLAFHSFCCRPSSPFNFHVFFNGSFFSVLFFLTLFGNVYLAKRRKKPGLDQACKFIQFFYLEKSRKEPAAHHLI